MHLPLVSAFFMLFYYKERFIMKFQVISVLALVTLFSCKKPGCTDPTAINYNFKAQTEDGSCEYNVVDLTIARAGSITANETWTANNVYKLVGKVVVEDGVTLTIEPGTIVKGEEGTGTLASALVIAQGGMLNAVGTDSAPIIFTSVLDNIQPGQLTGTNLTETDRGLWGGIIVLGRAKVSAGDGDVLSQIEGIPASDAFGAFGGTDDADNSGHLEYISIRHGGALIGAGNEINGLTLGGVGTGTTISNIEVVASLDDGIEFFGGTVNVSNIIVGYQGDDAIDIDMNYAGTIDKFLVINGNNSDESLEIDGPEGVTYTNGMFTLSNGSTNGNADFKSKAQGNIINVLLNTIKIRSSFETDCVTEKTDAYTNLINGNLNFSQTEYSSINVYTTTSCTIPTSYQTTAVNLISNSMIELSPVSVSWTWGYINGKY
jgi:hypothetical protein